jgi:hypothetical protein
VSFFLWGYVKDYVYSQRVNLLDELKVQITAANVDITKDIWQEVDCRGDVCRATDAAYCEVFHAKQLFHLCLKKSN